MYANIHIYIPRPSKWRPLSSENSTPQVTSIGRHLALHFLEHLHGPLLVLKTIESTICNHILEKLMNPINYVMIAPNLIPATAALTLWPFFLSSEQTIVRLGPAASGKTSGLRKLHPNILGFEHGQLAHITHQSGPVASDNKHRSCIFLRRVDLTTRHWLVWPTACIFQRNLHPDMLMIASGSFVRSGLCTGGLASGNRQTRIIQIGFHRSLFIPETDDALDGSYIRRLAHRWLIGPNLRIHKPRGSIRI